MTSLSTEKSSTLNNSSHVNLSIIYLVICIIVATLISSFFTLDLVIRWIFGISTRFAGKRICDAVFILSFTWTPFQSVDATSDVFCVFLSFAVCFIFSTEFVRFSLPSF